MFYMGLYWENVNKTCSLKPQGISSLDIWYVASSSGLRKNMVASAAVLVVMAFMHHGLRMRGGHIG